MEPENKAYNCEKPPVGVETRTSEGRRKLIRGALAGAPILLALKSSPVLACNCKLPSGFSASGNLSRQGNNNFCGDGDGLTRARRPGEWESHTSTHRGALKYNNTGISTSAPYNSIFTTSSNSTPFSTVLSGSDFAALTASAYLNAKSGAFMGIQPQAIIDMVKGDYKPNGSNKNWSQLECTNYLKYTMGL